LRAFASNPYSVAFLFGGETGTGKTSAALALAAELGCDLDQMEFGGVHMIASGEQSADAVRACAERMWLQPMAGSGWKVFIVNEAERMHIQAETVWLDRLENLPRKTVVVLTTNFVEKLSNRFRDRCLMLRFESDARVIQESVQILVSGIWKAETGKVIPDEILERVIREATQQGRLSFRRVVQYLQPLIPLKRKATK
jgi:DNA polymerase III delta prime subunit